MLEPIILFALGGAGYQAIELAWRGTTHWTMFAAGGACLCLLQQLARRRSLPLGAAALCGAAAASGVELGVGLPAATFCTWPCGTTAPCGAT